MEIDICTAELPPVWHISLGADVAFSSIIKVNETVFFLLYKFLLLLGLVRIELRRGFPLWTFPYTSISRAKADKKALKVLSLASFPEACCHSSLLSSRTACRSLWLCEPILRQSSLLVASDPGRDAFPAL